MRTDPDDSAIHRLSDGTEVRLRPLLPSDREKLRAGFRRLSPETRYRRFFSPMPKLSDAMLRRLTQTDGWNHLAILAEGPTADGGIDEILGVARFIRSSDSPEIAEASVAVIDAMHRRGLGRLLLTALVEAAHERGIRKFRAYVLPDNEPVKLLLQSFDEHASARIESGLRVYELALPEPSPEAVSADPMYRFLKLAAQGLETAFKALSGTRSGRRSRRPRAPAGSSDRSPGA
jgi:GNAT superfamily N-acetyltransferase